MQADLFGSYSDGYPGWKRTDTSRDAAKAMAPRAATLRDMVLSSLRAVGPMTADEVAAELRTDKLAIRPRFSELKDVGRIIDTGERRANTSGRKAIVWRAA